MVYNGVMVVARQKGPAGHYAAVLAIAAFVSAVCAAQAACELPTHGWEFTVAAEHTPAVAISRDGSRIAVSDWAAIYLLDRQGKVLWTAKAPPKSGFGVTAISDTGHRVLCWKIRRLPSVDNEDIDYNAVLFNGANGQVLTEIELDGGRVPTALSGDGRYILAGYPPDGLGLEMAAQPDPANYLMLLDDTGKTVWRSDKLAQKPVVGAAYGFLSHTGSYALLGAKDRLNLVTIGGYHLFDIALTSDPAVSADADLIMMGATPVLSTDVQKYETAWPVVAPQGEQEPQTWGHESFGFKTYTAAAALALVRVGDVAEESPPPNRRHPFAELVWAHGEIWAGNRERVLDAPKLPPIPAGNPGRRGVAYGSAGLLAIVDHTLLAAELGQEHAVKLLRLPGLGIVKRVGVSSNASRAYTLVAVPAGSDLVGRGPSTGSAASALVCTVWDRSAKPVATMPLSEQERPFAIAFSHAGDLLILAWKGKVQAFEIGGVAR